MIDYILFDMDNTLYPESSGLGAVMRDNMNAFVADLLHVSLDRARELRRENFKTFGTTIRWLQKQHGLTDLENFMEKIHPKDVSKYIRYNPSLVEMLQTLPVEKSILTNSPSAHADRVLTQLNIMPFFDHVFDITYNNYNGKPLESCFNKVLHTIGRKASQVLLIDDVPGYLLPFREISGNILLVDETGKHEASRLPAVRNILELPAYLESAQLISFHR